jgi:DNA invertase Pin-like site-specific DNA recombinase
MRVVLYSRVSTRDRGQDTQNQLLQLRQFAKRQGWKVVREYQDYASGRRADRDAFLEMFASASRREFDCLLFWSLDRLSREGAFATLKYLTRLTELGIGYVSFREEFLNSTGIFRDAVVSILATLAKQEAIRQSERTIAGLEKARAQGRVGGRPHVNCNVQKLLKLRSSGMSFAAIASKLRMKKSTVHRIAGEYQRRGQDEA